MVLLKSKAIANHDALTIISLYNYALVGTQLASYVFLFPAIEVSFSERILNVSENQEKVSLNLTLSRPTPCCIRLHVEVKNETADG